MRLLQAALFLLLVFGFSPHAFSAQPGDLTYFTEVLLFGTAGFDTGRGVALDRNGNVIVTGTAGGRLRNAPSAGFTDAFVMKLDPAGNEVWTRSFGTEGGDHGNDVVVDENGNVIITGTTRGNLHDQPYEGAVDVFVMKLDPDGNETWTRTFGTPGFDQGTGVALAGNGDIVVTGSTTGRLNGQPHAGDWDVFVMRLDPDGNEVWTRTFGTGTPDNDTGDRDRVDGGQSVAVDGNGDIVVTGITESRLNGQPHAGTGEQPGFDVFVMKLDPAGNETWTRTFGTPGNEWGYDVAVDGNGDIIVAGTTEGRLNDAPDAGEEDVFVLKLDPAGNEVWTRTFGTPENDWGSGVAVDGNDFIISTGYTEGSLHGQTLLGWRDAFVMKLDPSGNEVWTSTLGSPAVHESNGLKIGNAGGNAVVVGNGAIVITGFTETSLHDQPHAGNEDVFVFPLTPAGGF